MLRFWYEEGSRVPPRLSAGDEIRVIAPSRSMQVVAPDRRERAHRFFVERGFRLSYSRHANEIDETQSSSIGSRVRDLYEAFFDPSVKGILTALGGFNVNQLLPHLDYDLIAAHPKTLCGYSDITALHHAIYAKTGLVCYHGPHFSTFGRDENIDYTVDYFRKATMSDAPYDVESSDSTTDYMTIVPGAATGTVIGGNLCTLNLLQGTPYMPSLKNSVLFIEDDNIMGEYFPLEFERNLHSLAQTAEPGDIRGVVFGRFEDSCQIHADILRRIVSGIPSFRDIPILYGADFGHLHPMISFPIGGQVRLEV